MTLDINDPLRVYLLELATIPPLTRDEETQLLQRLRAKDELTESATRRLIEANLSLVVSIAERHFSGEINMLDLIQKGNEGLLFAVESFTGTSSKSLLAHVATCVEDAVLRAIAESQSKRE
jgi:RNA polymerase primary sigma factor